jgi:hypothetical protein
MGSNGRSKIDRKEGEGILFLCDEDLESIGVEPSNITDEQWIDVLEYLKDYYNDTFQHALNEAVSSILEDKL